MITQYAAASLVSENKVLSHPASVDSIPSSGNQEDHVSMGTIAARKSREILENVKRVIATEIMAACQAIDFREIPSSGNQEDHVSMGTIAARKSREILENVKRVIATEIMAACQAIDFREGLVLGEGTKAAYDFIREHVDFIKEDKVMYKDLDKITELITSEKLLKRVEEKVKLLY